MTGIRNDSSPSSGGGHQATPRLDFRHSRQARFAPIGEQGQARIAAARVLIIGCGALGTHLAEFCVRAGVGEITIVDRDFVEPSNLQRQSLFTESDALDGIPKAIAAKRALSAIDSHCVIHAHVTDFNHDNAEDIANEARPTLILDATDNFEARLLINDLACERNVPWVYAGCVGSRAVCMPIVPRKTACLACLLEDTPPANAESCETTGIIMPAVLAAVAMASAEALKLMLAAPGELNAATIARLVTRDVWTGETTSITAATPRADCPVCVNNQRPHLSGRSATAAIRLCGRNAVQIRPAVRLSPGGFDELKRRLMAAHWSVSAQNDFLIRISLGDWGVGGSDSDVRTSGERSTGERSRTAPVHSPSANTGKHELTIFADGRMLVSGTDDFSKARSIASRVVG